MVCIKAESPWPLPFILALTRSLFVLLFGKLTQKWKVNLKLCLTQIRRTSVCVCPLSSLCPGLWTKCAVQSTVQSIIHGPGFAVSRQVCTKPQYLDGTINIGTQYRRCFHWSTANFTSLWMLAFNVWTLTHIQSEAKFSITVSGDCNSTTPVCIRKC